MSQQGVDPHDRPLDFSDELVHVLIGLSASLDELAGGLEPPVAPHRKPMSRASYGGRSRPDDAPPDDTLPDDALTDLPHGDLLVDALLGLLSLRRTLHVWLAPIVHGDVEPVLHADAAPATSTAIAPPLHTDVARSPAPERAPASDRDRWLR